VAMALYALPFVLCALGGGGLARTVRLRRSADRILRLREEAGPRTWCTRSEARAVLLHERAAELGLAAALLVAPAAALSSGAPLLVRDVWLSALLFPVFLLALGVAAERRAYRLLCIAFEREPQPARAASRS
jgi:hypothetical protein